MTWHDGPPRLRLRRRLLVFSAPVAVVLVIAVLKLASVVIAGGAAVSDFERRDASAMRGDVATLNVLNVVQPAKARVAAGAAAVLDGRLDDADAQYTAALAADPESCSTRVDLEFVRETLGDRAVDAFDEEAALARYVSAFAAVDDAPAGCFEGNTDADPARRALRDGAATRLKQKLERVAPPAPPSLPEAAPPPPPPPGTAPSDPDARLRLDPGTGDPLEKLQQILRDAAAAQG